MHAQLAHFHHHEDAIDACDSFALVRGRKACNVATMLELISDAEQGGVQPTSTGLFDFDHVHPASPDGGSVVVVILHGFFGSAEFKPFHETLSRLAKEKRVSYALRHVTPSESGERVRLSGYGVELAVKSTEYKAQVIHTECR